MRSRDVVIGPESFPYFFDVDCLYEIGLELGRFDTDRFLLITDDTVLSLYGERLVPALERHAPVHVLSRPAGERMKSMSCLADHISEAIAAGVTRRSVVVAFGGGVPGNLGGMVAALLFRGIRLIHVPTTTMAAMDSVISLKQAVNSGHGKNHIGSYHRPQAVYTDVRLMQSLPERELRSGLCEAAKNCLAIRTDSVGALREATSDDPASIAVLLWLLEESLAAKLTVMANDAKERSTGLVLEYGHTVGHAVELCDQRASGPAGMPHGEAVGLGMVAAAHISRALGALDDDAVQLHEDLLAALGAPVTVPRHLDVAEIVEIARADGKRGLIPLGDDELAMVLLSELGQPLGAPDRPLVAVPIDVIERVLHELHTETQAPLVEPFG